MRDAHKKMNNKKISS